MLYSPLKRGYNFGVTETLTPKLLGESGPPPASEFQRDFELFKFALESIDVPTLVTSNPRDGAIIENARANSYSLYPLYAAGAPSRSWGWAKGFGEIGGNQRNNPPAFIGGNYYHIYLNTSIGFALFYKGVPQAVGGIKFKDNFAHLQQIQGVIGYKDLIKAEKVHSRGLAPLDWSMLMLCTAEEIARKLGAKRMRLDNAEAASGSIINNESLELLRARQVYDETALRAGYARPLYSFNQWWFKDLA